MLSLHHYRLEYIFADHSVSSPELVASGTYLFLPSRAFCRGLDRWGGGSRVRKKEEPELLMGSLESEAMRLGAGYCHGLDEFRQRR